MPEPHPHSDRSSLTYHNQQPDPTQETSPESGVNTRESFLVWCALFFSLLLWIFTMINIQNLIDDAKCFETVRDLR